MRPNLLLFAVLLQAWFCPARAVMFYATADPSHNTTAPTGALASSGWELQGAWGGFLGTIIGPRHFITATHIGGNVGEKFTWNEKKYITTARHVDTNTDLTIWEVGENFSDWAQLYPTTDEVGKDFVVFGRGMTRGEPVESGGPLNPVMRGWKSANYDSVQRWGENRIEDIVDADGNPYSVVVTGQAAIGSLLRATFDANAGPNEAGLSNGDSGGAVFIKDGDTWKLAGINYATDGPYNTGPTGAGFAANIFDEGGLYKGGENRWVLTADLPSNQAGAFFMNRISTRLDWIRSIIGDPGIPSTAPVLEFATTINGGFTEDALAVFDEPSMVIRTPNTGEQRFFRIRANQPIEILNLRREGSDLVFECRYP